MNYIQLAESMGRVIDRLAWEWLSNHSSNYTNMDLPPPRWDRLLKRPWVPPSGKVVDRFWPAVSGHTVGVWLLMGQLIGPVHNHPEPIGDLDEYWGLWADGLMLADEYRAQTGRHPARLPALWTLEAPPPHFFNSVRKGN